DRAPEDQQGGPRAFHLVLAEQADADALALDLRGRLDDLPHCLVEGLVCLLHADAGRQPTEGVDAGIDAPLAVAVGVEAERNPDVSAAEEPQVFRQHADDRVAVAAELDRLADDVRIASEPALPESVAE